MSANRKTIKIFIAYSQKDRTALDDLRTHAAPLLRQGNVEIWYDGEIIAGEVWDKEIKANLHAANIILLLLSPHSLASEYFYNEEVKDALKRHEAGSARVVPVLLSACLWKRTPLANLQGLPTGMTPIHNWPNRDDAWHNVLTGLSDLIDEIENLEKEPEATLTTQKTTEQKDNKGLSQPPQKEAHAWDFTIDEGTPAACHKFLDRFPDGFYADEARQLLEGFEADDTAWEFASHGASEKAIQKYLDKYPQGLHTTKAKELLAAFEHDRQLEAKVKKEKDEEKHRRLDPFYELMILVKGGTFGMGDTLGQGLNHEKPLHPVTLSDFWLCKYPVTQGLWKAVMGENNNPSHFKGDDQLPVEMVSWHDVQSFIGTLNKKSGQHYRLPTEAEWEYAARGGRESKRYLYSGSDNLDEVAWYDQNSGRKTHPVGSMKSNELGLYDMSGNVWEYCHDGYDYQYYEVCKKDGVVVNPTGPENDFIRVIRGGYYFCPVLHCRVASRFYFNPADPSPGIGFRLALQSVG